MDNMHDNFEGYDIENDNDNEGSRDVKVRCSGASLLIVIQLILCAIIILGFVSLKYISGEYFEKVSTWYNEKINDSLITDSSFEDYKKMVFKIINDTDDKEDFDLSKNCLTTRFGDNWPLCLTTNFNKPVENGFITSRFGNREIDGNIKMHYGMDISLNEGDNIYPVLPGVVKVAGEDQEYGKFVVLDHGNNVETLYAHCKDVSVNQGENVNITQPVAKGGATGNATGPHLHLEFKVSGKNYDPEPFLNGLYNDA